MKKRLIIGALFVFSFSILYTYNNYAKGDQVADDYREKNAINFVTKLDVNPTVIKNANTESSTNVKFDKKSTSSRNVYKQNRYIFENNQVIVEEDEYGNPITFENKDKKVSPIEKNQLDVPKLDKNKLDNFANKAFAKFNNNDAKLVDINNMHDGYVAYKWARTFNGYKYEQDFILVILDPSDGSIVSMSKRFLSKEPNNNVKINEEEAKRYATKYVGSTNKLGNIIKSEILVVSPINETTKKQKINEINSRLAYAVTFQKLLPSPGETIIWIDAENGQVLGHVTTK